MIEEWRAIPGYEGFYEVSDQGRVRSLDRYAAEWKLRQIREAHDEYEAALKRREHGGVAAAHFIQDAKDILAAP